MADPEKRPDDKDSYGDKAKESLKKFTNKVSEKFEGLKNNENLEGFRKFSTEHRRDTIVYLILLIGLITTIYYPNLGNTIIGVVVGLYFAEELAQGPSRVNHIIETQGIFRIVIFCFLAIALFFAAPMIFIGAAIAVAVKLLLLPKKEI
jgi:hypothetical protein